MSDCGTCGGTVKKTPKKKKVVDRVGEVIRVEGSSIQLKIIDPKKVKL